MSSTLVMRLILSLIGIRNKVFVLTEPVPFSTSNCTAHHAYWSTVSSRMGARLTDIPTTHRQYWVFPKDALGLFYGMISTEPHPYSRIHRIPTWVLDVVATRSDVQPILQICDLPTLAYPLTDYQVEAVRFSIQKKKVMLALDMGLGKTLCAVAVSQYHAQLLPQVIVCPASLLQNWKDEFSKHLPEVHNVHILTSKAYTLQLQARNIISYSLFISTKIQSQLRTMRSIGVLIIDESHYIKNRASKRSLAVVAAGRKLAQNVILLTGTPSSKPADLFPQIKVIVNRVSRFSSSSPYTVSSTVEYFGDRYCEPAVVRGQGGRKVLVYNGCQRVWEIHLLLSACVFRKTKRDVHASLPVKCRHKVSLSPTEPTEPTEPTAPVVRSSTQLQTYVSEELNCIDRLKANHDAHTANIRFSKLMRYVLPFRIDATLKFIDTMLSDSSNKLLVFARHLQHLQRIREHLHVAEVSFIYIDGSTPALERQNTVNAFQNIHNGIRVAVLSIGACAAGLNMFSANVVVFAELTFDPKLMLQAEDRCHRLGQVRPVSVYYLVIRYTVDDIMWRTLNFKVNVAANMIDNVKNSMYTRGMTHEV